ncbi:SGNH/GDSL hydrolase family protein [Kaistella sp. G5-32]|uniref:SGNH/GDSL hydrolase family protein n=1 Tax=Kaistella gelatinilytica TaxID=2787636 RepID=A0ABS0F9C2_9FLAO|nr:SGNH/GDSL hydrolase family protein [Kaistella gelatinilytica]MBF8456307.1 SGNH/GDSL hydrolase family protein [Kaistella gelatinilytica]
MKNNYFLHLLKSIPLLPIIYFQGKKIKKEIQLFPEAKNPEGFINANSYKNLKILFIGESSFAGVGVENHKNGFAGHFSNALSEKFHYNINWKVYAKTGYNVDKIQRKLIPLIVEKECNLLVIGIGGNDTFELNQPKKWRESVQCLINDLRKKFPETPVLFAQLPTIEMFPAFSKEMKLVLGNHKDILADHLNTQVLKNKNVYFPTEKINFKEWLGKLKEGQTVWEFFSDGIHPSELCYDLWAKDCVTFLGQSKINF